MATCEALGQKPMSPCAWWDRPWVDEEADIARMRCATLDELGDEVVSSNVDSEGALNAEQEHVEPETLHPKVAALGADGELQHHGVVGAEDGVAPVRVGDGDSDGDSDALEMDDPDIDLQHPQGPPQFFGDKQDRAEARGVSCVACFMCCVFHVLRVSCLVVHEQTHTHTHPLPPPHTQSPHP